MEFSAKVRTCLWFDKQGEDAARFYVSLLPDSHVENVFSPDPDGPALVVEFTLAGTPFMTLNGGPQFPHSEAASISVLTKDQAETDSLWDALIADGGNESQCGWLKDRFGVSWQIVPEQLPRCLASSDQAAAGRAMQAMMGMRKIDIAAIEAAFAGRTPA
jgi:predicted 3-demethylubiquinone-9 3-methyltransferase (glyoxalase superfamily)